MRRKASQKFYGDKAKKKTLDFIKEYSGKGTIVAVELKLQYDEPEPKKSKSKPEVKKVGTSK